MPLRNFESRIQIEQKIMSEEMPQFKFFRNGKENHIAGWQTTSTGNRYKLKLLIPPHYPDQVPHLYVHAPRTLKMHKNGSINDLGSTHKFHTETNGPGGCVQICHFTSGTWDASHTTIGVMLMGILWLEAYSKHLQTGKSIATIFQEQKNMSRERNTR